MLDFIDILLSGLATGAIYALAAIGFTLLWQTSQTINFAQGDFVMLPAFFVLAGTQMLGLPFWLACLVGLGCALLVLGVLFKRVLVDPMLAHGVLPLVIATIALGLFLREAVKTLYSAEAQPFPNVVPEGVLRVQGIAVSASDVAILLVTGTAVALLQLFLNRTPTGRAMQAVAQNRDVARILGIPVERMVLYTFLINAALVTLSSILISPVYLAKFSNGETLGLIAFIAAIVGGFNQIRGALVGGLLVGVLENLTAVYLSSEYRTAVPLILMIVVVMLRPQGLLGRGAERQV